MSELVNTRAALVTMAGLALYGENWSTKVAEALDVEVGALCGIQDACLAHNDYTVDASLVAGLVDLLRARASNLDAVADLLSGHLQR